jgi:hypothetical protein
MGSFEKKAAANGAPHNLILAIIKVLLFKGPLMLKLPLFFKAW